jgi:hypothetical protein
MQPWLWQSNHRVIGRVEVDICMQIPREMTSMTFLTRRMHSGRSASTEADCVLTSKGRMDAL